MTVGYIIKHKISGWYMDRGSLNTENVLEANMFLTRDRAQYHINLNVVDFYRDIYKIVEIKISED